MATQNYIILMEDDAQFTGTQRGDAFSGSQANQGTGFPAVSSDQVLGTTFWGNPNTNGSGAGNFNGSPVVNPIVGVPHTLPFNSNG